MGCWYSCPEQESVEFIEDCGKFSHIAYPGFNCIHCYRCQCRAGKLSLRVQQLDVWVETKTKDNVFVTLTISVQYQVQSEKAYQAFYKLTDSKQQISSYVFNVVRATVPHMPLDEVFEEKERIAKSIKDELTKALDTFGFSIVQALVNDVVPDPTVKTAMNEINAATRLRVAAVEKAEAQKIAMVKAAEGEAETKYLSGVGIARQRQAIVNGLRDSIGSFRQTVPEVNSTTVLELMMATQYFDMLSYVGGHNKSSTVFLPHGPGAVQDFTQQIRAGMMHANAADNMTRIEPTKTE